MSLIVGGIGARPSGFLNGKTIFFASGQGVHKFIVKFVPYWFLVRLSGFLSRKVCEVDTYA
jgi:hypothetical protein